MKQKPSATMAAPLRWVLLATSFGFVVVQLDVTIVNVALPRIGADLATGSAGLQWVVDSYTLAFAVLLLSAGALGDRLGSKKAYLAGFVVFTAASLACGLAPNGAALICARAFQGVGAALLVPSSLALLNHAFAHDPRLRARAIGIWTAASAVAIASGPVVGALLLRSFGWRSIFFVNFPVCALGGWLTLRAVRQPLHDQVAHALDLPGQFLAIAALTGLTAAVIEFRPLGAFHPVVLGGTVVALGAGAGFVAVEKHVRAPMLPLSFFALPNVSAATVFGILVNFTYYGVVFVLSFYLQQTHGYSPLRAGAAYLPLTVTFIFSNLSSGWMAGRFGPRTPMVLGALIGAAGFGLLHRLDAGSPFLAMLPAFILIPGGMGLAVPAMTTAILASVERARSGTASGVLNAARQAGGAMGVAVFGALAGGGHGRIVAGLKASALISAGLLLVGAVLASSIRPHSPQV
jgi:DHA2 family methylenomycin A resistance protein-like MFS transporter